MAKTIVVAIGGNSLITDEKHQSVPDQYHAIEQTSAHLGDLIQDGNVRLVITHGNGPQVGFILRRSEIAAASLHQVPLDSCVADTQGALGYHLQRALRNAFQRTGVRRRAVTVVTQVLVDRKDPAFQKPTKPIGAFLTREKAEEYRVTDGWDVAEDSGRGWRRVVSSPAPIEILEIEAIRTLLDAGFVVIAAGGGGIAVVEDQDGAISGATAVVDKDSGIESPGAAALRGPAGGVHGGGAGLPRLREATQRPVWCMTVSEKRSGTRPKATSVRAACSPRFRRW